MNEKNNIDTTILKDFISNSKEWDPRPLSNIHKSLEKPDIDFFTRAFLRNGVINTDPPDGFFVEQGCLGISTQTLLTGGLGPCIAVTMKQSNKTHHMLAHIDGHGFNGHAVDEISTELKKWFDFADPGFEFAIHNWYAYDDLKPTVVQKVHELANAMNYPIDKIKLGRQFTSPLETVTATQNDVAIGFNRPKAPIVIKP